MSSILGTWMRNGMQLSIMKDRIETTLIDPLADTRRTLKHDYLLEANRIQLYSPTVRDIKHAFKGELRVLVVTPYEMTLESEGSITQWHKK